MARIIASLYRLQLSQQLSRSRILTLLTHAGFLIVVAVAADNAQDLEGSPKEFIINFLASLSLGLLTPIVALLFAGSTLGQLIEDETLVYVWLRPYPRWVLAFVSWAAAVSITLPAVVIPTSAAVMILINDPSTALVVALVWSLASIGYCAIFCVLGLVVRRSLQVGLVYIAIWELTVSRVGAGAAKLSFNTYPHSVLARLSEIDLPSANLSLRTGLIVPFIITVIGIGLTTLILSKRQVA